MIFKNANNYIKLYLKGCKKHAERIIFNIKPCKKWHVMYLDYFDIVFLFITLLHAETIFNLSIFNENLQDWSVAQVFAHITRGLILIEWFLAELWPLNEKGFFCVLPAIQNLVLTILLRNHWCNFIQTLQEW
jgi:hypothetical protein